MDELLNNSIYFYYFARILDPPKMLEEQEEEKSLLGVIKGLSASKTTTFAKEERTAMGSNHSAFAIGGAKMPVTKLTTRDNIVASGLNQNLKKQTNKIARQKNVFQTKLEQNEAKKTSRKIYYEQTVNSLNKWDSHVKKFRVDPHLDLRNVNERVQMVPTEARTRKLGTELEQELHQVLYGSKYLPEDGEELSRAEKEILQSVSVEEAKNRRIELQKHRHLQCKNNF